MLHAIHSHSLLVGLICSESPPNPSRGPGLSRNERVVGTELGAVVGKLSEVANWEPYEICWGMQKGYVMDDYKDGESRLSKLLGSRVNHPHGQHSHCNPADNGKFPQSRCRLNLD